MQLTEEVVPKQNCESEICFSCVRTAAGVFIWPHYLGATSNDKISDTLSSSTTLSNATTSPADTKHGVAKMSSSD